MPFMLVIVQSPDPYKSVETKAWSSFQGYARLETLKEAEGVFYINDTAWIFDTKKTLPEYGLVIHQANEFHIQLFSFQLERETLRSHLASYPRSEKLEAFLAS
jgi:hypothetical protein